MKGGKLCLERVRRKKMIKPERGENDKALFGCLYFIFCGPIIVLFWTEPRDPMHSNREDFLKSIHGLKRKTTKYFRWLWKAMKPCVFEIKRHGKTSIAE